MLSREDRLRFIYLEHLTRLGKPSGYFSFNSRVATYDIPAEIVVFYWENSGREPVTVFGSLGMSSFAMQDGAFAEIHLSVRGSLNTDQIMQFCRFVANFAIYPFFHGVAIDWWHLIIDVGKIPVFSDSFSLLIHPEFPFDNWAIINIGDEHVKILNIIPLTESEAYIVQNKGILKLLDYMSEKKIDIFQIR